MKKLLMTGFDPFGGERVNPSWEAVSRLPQQIGEYQLTKLQIPTVFGKAAQAVLARAEELHPDAIVCVGQAGGRSAVTPEQVAINLRYAKIADNAGQQPQDMPVAPDGPAAYFATVRFGPWSRPSWLPDCRAPCPTAPEPLCATICYIRCCMPARVRGYWRGSSTSRICPSRRKRSMAPSLTLEQMVQALIAAILGPALIAYGVGGEKRSNQKSRAEESVSPQLPALPFYADMVFFE